MSDLLVVRGRWNQAATLQRIALTAARGAGDRPSQAYTLSQLGVVQSLTGNFPAAAIYQQAIALYRDAGYQGSEAYVLNALGTLRSQTGDYPAAIARYQQALALAQGSGNLLRQVEALHGLASCSGWPATTPRPPPACSRLWPYAATSPTGQPGPGPCSVWASCSRRPGITQPPA